MSADDPVRDVDIDLLHDELGAVKRLHEVAPVTQAQRVTLDQLAILGRHHRAAGLTHTGIDAHAHGYEPHPTIAAAQGLMHVALDLALTPMAAAAVRLAAEHPELPDLPTRRARTLARRYLPAAGAAASGCRTPAI
jgi:hypothetical protein